MRYLILIVLSLSFQYSLFAENVTELEQAADHFDTAIDLTINMDEEAIQAVDKWQKGVKEVEAKRKIVEQREIEVEDLQSSLNMLSNRPPFNPQNPGQGGGNGGGSGGGSGDSGGGSGSPQIPEFSSAQMPDRPTPATIDSSGLNFDGMNKDSNVGDFSNNLGGYTSPSFSKKQQPNPQQFSPAQVAANGMPKFGELPAMQTPSNASPKSPAGPTSGPTQSPMGYMGNGGMASNAGAGAMSGDPFGSVGYEEPGNGASGITARGTEAGQGGDGEESSNGGGLSYGGAEVTRTGTGSLGTAAKKQLKLSRYMIAQILEAPEGNVFQKASLSLYDYCGFLGEAQKDVDRPEICAQAVLNEEQATSSPADIDNTTDDEEAVAPHKNAKKNKRDIASITAAQQKEASDEDEPETKVPKVKGVKSKKSIPDDLLEAIRAGVL